MNNGRMAHSARRQSGPARGGRTSRRPLLYNAHMTLERRAALGIEGRVPGGLICDGETRSPR